ncbi:MAG: hypothetical protein ACOC6G_02495 [Thermoproteota archaeon]
MEVKVTPKGDGAIITVDGSYEITLTVQSVRKATNLAEVQSQLREYADDLSISETEEEIVVKPEGYLGRGKFKEIAAKMRELGGTYISAGKDSRFVISKET